MSRPMRNKASSIRAQDADNALVRRGSAVGFERLAHFVLARRQEQVRISGFRTLESWLILAQRSKFLLLKAPIRGRGADLQLRSPRAQCLQRRRNRWADPDPSGDGPPSVGVRRERELRIRYCAVTNRRRTRGTQTIGSGLQILRKFSCGSLFQSTFEVSEAPDSRFVVKFESLRISPSGAWGESLSSLFPMTYV